MEHLSEIISQHSASRTPEVGAAVTLAELGDEHIRRVLAKTARLEDAAEILGIDLATLYRRRRKWQEQHGPAMEGGGEDAG